MLAGDRRHGALLLQRVLLERGGPVAQHVPAEPLVPPAEARSPGPPQIAAAGPRARGREERYELALALIEEGSRLHSAGRGWVVRPEDPDLALLLGDHLYAEGLLELVALEDLGAVAELADVISVCATAQVEGDPAIAEAAWEAGGRAVGHGEEGAGALRAPTRQGSVPPTSTG